MLSLVWPPEPDTQLIESVLMHRLGTQIDVAEAFRLQRPKSSAVNVGVAAAGASPIASLSPSLVRAQQSDDHMSVSPQSSSSLPILPPALALSHSNSFVRVPLSYPSVGAAGGGEDVMTDEEAEALWRSTMIYTLRGLITRFATSHLFFIS